MSNNVPLSDIRAFVEIASSGSFTRAAEELSVSRAHLSRQLAQLEERLGVQLLIRTTRSQRLTKAGRHFFERCQAALGGLDQAVVDVIDENRGLRGALAINCVGGPLGEEIVAPLLARFGALYPDIDVTLDFTSQRVDLVGDGFDLVLRMGALEDSRFMARKLADLEIETLASPAFLEHAGSLTHPSDLKAANCLTGSVARWSFQRKGQEQDRFELSVKGNFRCRNGRALIQAALNGNGIVRLPRFYCREEIRQGRLCPVFSDWETLPVPLYLLYHRKNYQPERLRVLIDFLVEGLPGELS
ncbi:LysR family transcriptional regulator [Kiloniella sp. b19]|uniref:LysR family transcriptional regulator n=1 Tax=Kiloniella sp. GXU_MW_B19 TaxID=3141326 RepID=UPI0031D3306F